MTGYALPIGTLSFNAQQNRQAFAALYGSGVSGLQAMAGVRPGPGLDVTVASGTITVTAGAAIVQSAASALGGGYLAYLDASFTQSITAADGTFTRIDLVYLRVRDTDMDGSGFRDCTPVYLAGTPSASPVAPSIPGGTSAIILATINVPKSGTGSPSVSYATRQYAVASGGVGVGGTPGAYAGQYRDGGTLQRYNGSSWEDKWYLAQAGQINIGSSASSATIAAALASTATFLLSSRVAGDASNRFTSTSTGQLQWGDGTLTQDTTLARTAPGVLTATGTLTMTGVGQTRMAYKALGTSRVSTIVATDDPDLTMAVSGTGTYAVEFHLYYASGATGKFLTQWDVPAGVTGLRSALGLDSSVSNSTPSGIMRSGMHAFTTGVAYGDRASASELYALETGVVTGAGTDGVIALKWAQSVSNATSVGLGAGSWMRVTRIA